MKPHRLLVLPLAFTFAILARAQPADWAPNLTVAATWQSNATNAARASDSIGALQLRADTAVSRFVSLARDDSLVFEGLLAAEAWPRFDGLDLAELGAAVTWRHKFGLGAQAPVFSLQLATGGTAARESDRAGFSGGATAAWSQRFGETTRLTLSHARTRFSARGSVFDRTAAETALRLTQELDPRWQLAVTARLRQGDVVSYATPPRPDLVALARVRTTSETFDRPFVAYSLSARTLAGGLALARTLDDRTSLTFGYEYRETEKSPLRYGNHLVSTTLVHQF